jgi:hypothetical protein
VRRNRDAANAELLRGGRLRAGESLTAGSIQESLRSATSSRVVTVMKIPTIAILAAGCVTQPTTQTDENATVSTVCSALDGSLHPIQKADELKQLAIGRWAYCSGYRMVNNDDAGIELLADGTYYVLVKSGGQLVRKAGFDSQGTWNVPNLITGLRWTLGPASWRSADVQLEDSPRKFALDFINSGDRSIYARLP